MEKLKRIFSLIIATVLIGLFITEPVTALAEYDIKNKDIYVERSFDESMYMDNKKLVESRDGVFKLDLKKVSSDLGYNYALLISWRLNKNTKPGNILSITLPQNLQLNIDGKIEEERGTFLGEVLHKDKAIFNLFYSDYKLNFYLTEEGAEISKTKDLFATDILLNLNMQNDTYDTYLSYIVENYKGMTYELIDTVDEISYEKLFKTEDEVIIEEPQGTEILEPNSNIKEIEIKDKEKQNSADKKPLLNLFAKPKSEEVLTEDIEDLSEDKDGVLSTIEKEKKALLETQSMEEPIFEDRNNDKASRGILDEIEIESEAIRIIENDKASRGVLDEIEIESESTLIRENQDFDYEVVGVEDLKDATDDKGIENEIEENPLEENMVSDKENLDVLPQEEKPELLPEVEQKDIKENKTRDLQIRNLTEIVPSPRRDLLLITKDAMDKFLSTPKFVDKSDLYTLRKTVEILDVRGMTRQEEQIVGDYLADTEGKLVFEDLQDGRYTFIKEGEGPIGKSFTVKEGIVDYDGNILLENILDISEKASQLNKSKELNKDLSKEKDLITIEVEINDSEGKAIDPKGAIYSVYRLNKEVQEKIDTLTWENEPKIEEPKDDFENKSDILQMLEESKVQFENTDDKLLKNNEIENINFKETLDISKINSYPKEILQVPAGTYILKEEKPPIGYEKTQSDIELSVAVEEHQANEAGEVLNNTTDRKDIGERSLDNDSLIADDRKNENEEEILPEASEDSLKPTLDDDKEQKTEIQNNKIEEEFNSDGANLKDEEETEDIKASIDNKENLPAGNVLLKAKTPVEENNVIVKVEENNSIGNSKKLKILYQARAGETNGTLKIETVDKLGNKLFYGGTSSAEIGNLRDAALNHDATYGVYKKNDQTGNYEPLNIYNKMVYDPNLKKEVPAMENGHPVMVNYKNGKFGTVTLDNLPPGDYVVKEIKSVFQYAFKNTAMKFTVGADGKITNFKDATVDLADYEQNQTIPSTGEVNRVKLTYNQKMDLDSKRVITETEVHEVENANINEVSENQTTKTVAATYHKGNLRVKKVDKNGDPIEGVTLELHGHDANRILRIYRVTTDANGIAEFKDLNVPSYHLLKEVAAPEGYALPNHQWMIYFGEGTWVEFDNNHKPKTEHIPLQISDNQIYATKVQLKPIIKLNPQETRQVVENDKYRPLIDGVTGASIAPKNWFQFLGINNPKGAPAEGTPEAETYWASNWNDPAYFAGGDYEKSFNASKDQLFYNTRETLTQSTDDVNVYNFEIINKPRAKVTVNKKDDQGNILPGATFAIYKVNEDGSQTPMKKGLNDWTEVSGLDGKAIFDNIPEGNYVIKETKSPGGYRGDGREYKITVDENANIKFEDNTEKVETLYEKVSGTYMYRNTDWFGQTVDEDIFSIKSKITSIDTKNKTFEGIFYLTCYDNIDKQYINLYLNKAGYGAEFQVLPYVEYFENQFPTEYRGRSNSATTSINTFETFSIKTGSTNYMPDDMNPDLSNTNIYTSRGEEAYNPNKKLGFEGIDSPNGVIIKIKGSYEGDKPIFTQGVLTHTDRPNDDPGYSTSGVKVTGEDVTVEKESQLDFDVTNTRDTATPLDNKGVIKLSKTEAGTSNLVGGAEFGLYVGKWDQIGERDKPFAKATTKDAQIGNETLHDGKLVNLKFQDIPPGTYTLKELSAPYGYEKTLHTWTVRVFASGLTLISLNPTFEEDPTLEEPVNVNDKITVSDFNIKVDSERPRTTIYPNINEFFEMTFKTKMANGIRRGNYFTIDLDEKLSLEGTLAQVDLPDMTLNGYVLATGEKIPGTNTVKYTFTEAVENIGDVTSDFTVALSPNRKVVLNDTKTTFTVNVAGTPFTTADTFGIDYSGAYPSQFGGMYWLPDYNGYYPGTMTSLSTAFINKIDNENAEIQNIFYSRPVKNQVTARTFYFTRGTGVLGPNNKTSYELYVVNNPNFVANPDITSADANNSDMSQTMPRSFAANLDDTANYTLIGSGTMPDDGKITIPTQYANSHLILKTVSPYDLKKERAYISVQNVGLYGGTYQYTQTVTTNIVTKPSKIFSQTDLTEGEVLAFNKKKDPMYFNLWKRDTKKEMINKGEVKFKMEVAEDYPDSTPVPDDLKEITFDLSNQTLDPLNPLKIEIPAGMTGEYNLTETSAPKGYIVNGLTYRIKVDSSKRTVQLISVKDSQGNPVEYKFKLPGAATESSLTAVNPAPLYKEQVDASGKITVDTQIVAIDVLDPQGEFPKSGGLGITLFYIGGIGLMTLAMIFIDKIKKSNEYMGKGGY